MRTNISFSIVSYKSSQDDLFKLVESIHAAAQHCAEKDININVAIQIVNNYCLEGEMDRLRNAFKNNSVVEIINSKKNGGYGYGNNLSINLNIRKSTYHVVLNPDVILFKDSLYNFLIYMEMHQNIGLLVPKILSPNGMIQHLCKRNPSFKIMILRSLGANLLAKISPKLNNNFLMLDMDYDKEIQGVEYPSGCCLFFRMSILEKIGGFDERYFLHYEDADIGRKVATCSKTVYRPDVVVTHGWARDTHKSLKMKIITIISGFRYLLKWNFERGNK
jgi:GT2 family glycosyltransferase